MLPPTPRSTLLFAKRDIGSQCSFSTVSVTKAAIADALSRGYLGGDGRLREEDRQKVDELWPLLAEAERALRKRGAVHVVDACAGKSAFGVLLAALVLQPRGQPFRITALERNPRLAALFTAAGAALGVAAHVELRAADVSDPACWPDAPDLVVALHACGAASDAVMAQGARVAARRMLVVPCCYGAAARLAAHEDGAQIPGQRDATAWASALSLPEHALVRRRFSQAIIDAERTLRLEAAGYQTEVIELFSPTVSPFCLCWRARRVAEPVRTQRAQQQWDALRAGPASAETTDPARSRS